MSLFTFSVSPVKGTPTQVNLDKAAISALGSISADAYWSDAANVQRVVAHYASTTGNQRLILTFNYSQLEPSADLTFSLSARSSFVLDMLTLVDFDGGTLTLDRASLEAEIPAIASLDISPSDPS
jgi:hypothetical protein